MGEIYEDYYEQKVELLTNLLKQSKHPVVFTGAGISTESGLKDFRGKDGLWKNKDPMKLACVDDLNNNCNDFIEFYKHRITSVNSCKPNDGHKILAKWLKNNYIKGIITQNVDGYHGLASNKINDYKAKEYIKEIHGDISTLRCMNCSKDYPSSMYEDNKT